MSYVYNNLLQYVNAMYDHGSSIYDLTDQKNIKGISKVFSVLGSLYQGIAPYASGDYGGRVPVLNIIHTLMAKYYPVFLSTNIAPKESVICSPSQYMDILLLDYRKHNWLAISFTKEDTDFIKAELLLARDYMVYNNVLNHFVNSVDGVHSMTLFYPSDWDWEGVPFIYVPIAMGRMGEPFKLHQDLKVML